MSKHTPVIVYVDDAAAAREAFTAAFAARFDVTCTASADEALARLGASPAHVLVSAEQQADPTRRPFLARVREMRPELVVVALVAERSLEGFARPLGDGLVTRCVARPADPRELGAVLDWAVELASVSAPGSELQRRARELERLALLGTISSSALHEVNQPLSYLTANSDRLAQLTPAATALAGLVARHAAELDPGSRRQLADLAEELPDIIRDMVEGCRLMRGMTSSMRAIGGVPIAGEARACDPHRTVEYVLGVCRKAAVAGHVTLSYLGPASLPQVAMSAAELSQVLIALVTNAVEAFDRAVRERGRAAIEAALAGDGVRLVVSDDGPGMAPEILARAGTPFFSTKPSSPGLGLAMARRLVGAAGGSVEVASTPGAGTRVIVTLPGLGQH